MNEFMDTILVLLTSMSNKHKCIFLKFVAPKGFHILYINLN